MYIQVLCKVLEVLSKTVSFKNWLINFLRLSPLPYLLFVRHHLAYCEVLWHGYCIYLSC